MENTLKIKLLSDKAHPIAAATDGSAGLDLYACIDAPMTIAPHTIALIPTGIAIALPSPEYVALVCARSGLAIRHGLSLANGVGVIDSDYRGEIRVGLINNLDTPYTVEVDERIAQLLVMPVCVMKTELTSTLPETERGVGGFGSTGRK